MTHSPQLWNALTAIARTCSDEMKLAGLNNLTAHRIITDKHAQKAIALGFTKTAMMVQIGRVNGVLKDRSLEG